MIERFQHSYKGAMSRIEQQEMIANNLANINTVGFKKQKVFKEVFDLSMDGVDGQVKESIVFEQGPMRVTNNQLDFALDGNGFFTIQTDQGDFYTRNGQFRVNELGQLCMESGDLVLGESGPITVSGEFSVNERGEIFSGNEMVDRFQLTAFSQPYALQNIKGGLFAPTDESVDVLPADQVAVKQGFLEESNVNAIEEMVNMMTVYRLFEADQKMITSQDDILNKAVNEISRV